MKSLKYIVGRFQSAGGELNLQFSVTETSFVLCVTGTHVHPKYRQQLFIRLPSEASKNEVGLSSPCLYYHAPPCAGGDTETIWCSRVKKVGLKIRKEKFGNIDDLQMTERMNELPQWSWTQRHADFLKETCGFNAGSHRSTLLETRRAATTMTNRGNSQVSQPFAQPP